MIINALAPTNVPTIVATAPRMLFGGHAAEKWQFIRDADGHFYAQEWFDTNQLDKAERKAFEASQREQEQAEAAYLRSFGDEPQERHLFRTLEDAKLYAALHDEMLNVDEDMRAFNAPSECAADAHRSINARRKVLMEREVGR